MKKMPKGKAKTANREKKREGGEDVDSPISTADRNPTRKEEEENDERPLSLSKSKKVKKNKNSINYVENQQSPVEKSKSKPSQVNEEEENEEDKGEEDKKKKKERVANDEMKVDKKNKKEKKVCDLPGQKHDRPDERDPLRIFYETLYQQLPDSELAATWMMEWGLLPADEAQKLYEEKLKKNMQQKFKSSAKNDVSLKKTSKKQRKTPSSTSLKTKKRKASENREDLILPKENTKKQKVSAS